MGMGKLVIAAVNGPFQLEAILPFVFSFKVSDLSTVSRLPSARSFHGKRSNFREENGVHVRQALDRTSCYMRPRSKGVLVYI